MNLIKLTNKKNNYYFITSLITRLYLFAMASHNANNDSMNLESSIEKVRRKNYKILVIDDDDRFRKSLCFKLKRKFNAQVEDVNSGMLGIVKLKTGNQYDLILTDIMMPEMTGIETYYAIRKIDSEMKIVVMSAYSSSEEWKKAQELKDVTLLHKPFSDEDLIKVFINDDED